MTLKLNTKSLDRSESSILDFQMHFFFFFVTTDCYHKCSVIDSLLDDVKIFEKNGGDNFLSAREYKL